MKDKDRKVETIKNPKQLEKLSEEELKQVRGGSLNTYTSKLVGEKQGSKK